MGPGYLHCVPSRSLRLLLVCCRASLLTLRMTFGSRCVPSCSTSPPDPLASNFPRHQMHHSTRKGQGLAERCQRVAAEQATFALPKWPFQQHLLPEMIQFSRQQQQNCHVLSVLLPDRSLIWTAESGVRRGGNAISPIEDANRSIAAGRTSGMMG